MAHIQRFSKLLTPQEIVTVNGGALGLIPQGLMKRAFEDLPPAVRQVMEAEARIRDTLKRGIESYEDLERIAMRTGIVPGQEGDRQVPEFRWSYHSDGYFVRYHPLGYSRTLMEISVPAFFTTDWDEKGRIVGVADNRGNSLEIEFDDSVPPLTLENGKSPIAYPFRVFRITQAKAGDSAITREWTGRAWMLVAAPGAKSPLEGELPEGASTLERDLQWANSHKADVDALYSRGPSMPWRDGLAEKAVQFGLFAKAVQQFLKGRADKDDRLAEASVILLKEAWQNWICLAMMKPIARKPAGQAHSFPFFAYGLQVGNGGPAFSLASSSAESDDSGDGGLGFDLSGGSAVPGKQGRQRLGMGGPGDDEDLDDLFERADKYGDGYEKGYRDGGGYGTGDGYQGNDYNDIPIEPLVDVDPDWMDGYRDGYTKGYSDGYKLGESMR